ncbi:hypothetical protein tinsulaeT_20330 [Thalassotalea insulae]|uniref:MEMO1 family protein tinsulaeT_20330 n=1 Tax=Thalassotalea insulae TaxID=2056778 RepID=A0ABQ6GRX2_9GAMM|nr:AmmeMemoRadiSam system protein B [Thalassotalea insulae]GLX78693.1 hypothetical protein tinsulaeT_20330 [Thalassotalea insulae]
MKYRQPAVAGKFYPLSAVELRHQLASFFAEHSPVNFIPKALIVPHAGYFYSGAIAAKAYQLLENHECEFRRIALLGPSHHIALHTCAVPEDDLFITPLGEITIDKAAIEQLLALGLATSSDSAHHWEHSLEVQLPFLQYCLDDFTLVPLVVGQCSPQQVMQLIAYLRREQNTLVVVSSDLSHYHPYAEAKIIDQQTCQQIEQYQTPLIAEQACGCHAINGLLTYAERENWQIDPVIYANSGDVLAAHQGTEVDNEQEVVGYASFVLY